MSRKFPDSVYPNLRYFVGDIRDYNRIYKALKDVDYVIHAAALKQVPSCEYNPSEAVATNILGTQNVINACIERKVNKAIFLSTDKAVEAVNLYGLTKAVAERLWINANISDNTKFNVVRYGNVMGSRGSVIPYFEQKRDAGEPIPITHPTMTRFWIRLEDAVKFALSVLAIDSFTGGGIYIPKLPAMDILDLAEAIAPGHDIIITGIRPGEKIHERLISKNEVNIEECEDRYIIHPFHNVYTNDEINQLSVDWLTQVDYSSNNAEKLSIERLREIIKQMEEQV
jgi:UDP-N-acetylglucosamine 4,6-dehydratase